MKRRRKNPGARHHLAALHLLATSQIPEGIEGPMRQQIEGHRQAAERWLRELIVGATRRTGSFAGAARELRCSPRTIGRAVARDEVLKREAMAARVRPDPLVSGDQANENATA